MTYKSTQLFFILIACCSYTIQHGMESIELSSATISSRHRNGLVLPNWAPSKKALHDNTLPASQVISASSDQQQNSAQTGGSINKKEVIIEVHSTSCSSYAVTQNLAKAMAQYENPYANLSLEERNRIFAKELKEIEEFRMQLKKEKENAATSK